MSESISILNELALRYGSTVEELWQVVLRQQVIYAWVNLCVGVLLLAGAAIYLISVRRWDNSTGYGFQPLWVEIGPLVIGLSFIVGASLTGSGILRFVNPVFYAIRAIVGY